MVNEEADKKESTEAECLFTEEELESLSEIDSTLYGFLDLNLIENAKKKALIVKAAKCLEKVLIELHFSKKYESLMENHGKSNFDNESEEFKLYVKIFCKLGHLNLLLEEYPKALSAYQHVIKLRRDYYKVCELYFKPDGIIQTITYFDEKEGKFYQVPRNKPIVKDGAIPTIFSGLPSLGTHKLRFIT